MDKDLKLIKKYYGEKMMHLCRELFPTILEEEGLLSKLMLDNFAPNKQLYYDIEGRLKTIESFKEYIYSLLDYKKNINKGILKTPEELLSEAGYDLYECKTEEDIQKFKKYYLNKEELCTFNGGRLNYCHVFFAVKKNVDEIKRSDKPDRQDEYGTSVISIQFTRGSVNTLSIKNRYNHTVINPDATYSNNLENIVEGLTESFEKKYNLRINQNSSNYFELGGYVQASDGKFYKYNYEINNIYYCPNNIIIDNFEVKHFDKEKYIVLDYFILDLVNKKIYLYDKYMNNLADSFGEGIQNIKNISIVKQNGIKVIKILTHNNNIITIKIDKLNRIIGYKNNKIKNIGNNFLRYNKELNELELSNVETIENDFLVNNIGLEKLILSSLKKIGSGSLYFNKNINLLEAPNLEYVGSCVLFRNEKLKEVSLPKLKEVGRCFLRQNRILETLYLPKLTKVDDEFLNNNNSIKILDLPSLIRVYDKFMSNNNSIEIINLPKLKIVGNNFMFNNKIMRNINLPKLEIVGDEFFMSNSDISIINLPKLISVGKSFIMLNRNIQEINLPNLERVGSEFLSYNSNIKYVNLPKLSKIGSYFLYYTNQLKILYLPNIDKQGERVLSERFKIFICKKELKNFLHCLKEQKSNEYNIELEMIDRLLYKNNKILIKRR